MLEADGPPELPDRPGFEPRLHPDIFHQRRNEEVADKEGKSQVCGNDPDEICKVGLLFLRQEEHHQEGSDGGRNGRKYGREDLPVMPVAEVVNHHDRGVDHDSERDGDTGESVDVDWDSEE